MRPLAIDPWTLLQEPDGIVVAGRDRVDIGVFVVTRGDGTLEDVTVRCGFEDATVAVRACEPASALR